MKKILSLILTILSILSTAFGQSIEIDMDVSPELTTCGIEENMIVRIHNKSLSPITSPELIIKLPTGIIYSAGSLNESTNSNVTAINMNNSNNLLLSANSLAIGDSIVFEIEYSAYQSAIDFQNSGGIFRNQLTILSDGQTTMETSISYNILSPALSILQITPAANTILSGSNQQRTINIINGGIGRTDKIFITDERSTNELSLDNVDIGTISGDTIILSGSDFSSIGNFDNYLDQNENITITETLTGTSCSDVTITSAIKVHWGCEPSKISTTNSYGNISIDFKSPNLKLLAVNSASSCFGMSEYSQQELGITNTGTGISSAAVVTIFKSSGNGYDETIFSKLDPSSFTIKLGKNGTESSITGMTSYPTQSTNNYNCLGNSPIGKVSTSIPNLNPGDTLYINWNIYSCCITECANQKIMGWAADLSFSDVCEISNYSKSINGQDTNQQNANFTMESPINLIAGQPNDYTFIVSSFENTLPEGIGAHYQAKFELEDDLDFNSLNFTSNGIAWSPFFINYDPNTNTVIAKYPAHAPFVIPKSELILNVTGTCGNAGWKTIDFQFAYIADTTCILGSCAIPLECSKQVTSYLHCPNNSCNSLKVLDFEVNRINFGFADNNLDGNPDIGGVLDFSKVKANRAMVGDTIEATFNTVIGTTNDTWSYLSLKSNVDFGAVLNALTTEVKVYDNDAAIWHVITGISPVKTISSNQAEFSFDFSATNLSTYNSALTGFEYSSNDSIKINIKYRVISSVSGLLKETTFMNELYLSQVSNPSAAQKEACSFRHGRITLIGFDWRNDGRNYVTVNNCSKVVQQNFGLSIGDKSSNYNGGNLFPFEYRHWGIIKEAFIVIPKNYSHKNTTIKYYRTKKTNTSMTQTINNIIPTSISGDTLYYNLEQYFTSNLFALGDDGFAGKIQVELTPNCFANVNTYEDVKWAFNYQESAAINANESGYVYNVNSDRIRYSPPNLVLSSTNPWQDANTKNVNWDFKIKNTSTAGAGNNWIHIVAPQNIMIDSITNDNTGQLLVKQSDIYLAGTVNGGNSIDLTIHGTFTGCDTVLLTVFSGAECIGYPSDFASFNCSYKSIPLYVEPKISGYQPRISTLLMSDPCTPQAELSVDITSVKVAHMYDMTIDFISPDTNKIKVLDGTSYFKYNMSNAFQNINDPIVQNSIYNYDINSLNSDFTTNGIPGVADFTNNRYILKSIVELGQSFENGDYLQIQINGKNACGTNLPTLNLAYDPSSKFKKDNTAGLNLNQKNNWSGSWGDYDNDGFDDLFVPSKSLNETNTLYHNNQDGTFTEVTSGPIVTDLGASVSGTWGDYDNDGFLDLFVANNENSSNKLYHNNGDGTFTSIQNSPIVDKGIYTHAAAWADYNQDGNLDLAISDFHPTKFNFLFAGDGQGGFTVDNSSLISQSATSAVGLAWGDYDNDGDQDLFIANTNGENNQFFINQSGIFLEVFNTNLVSNGGSSVGGVWGDYDNDGYLDLFVTNSSISENNFFYENNGDGSFTTITNSIIVTTASTSHGASWIDYDNDGDLDLLVANDQNQNNFLFANNGDKTFTQLTNAVTEETGNSLGTAWADYDNDGDYDLFVANRDANSNDFYVNEKGSCTNHIAVKLVGCNSNKFGIGAQVQVKSTINGQAIWQTKHVSTQTSAMGGQNSTKLLFGLNKANTIDSLIVKWPSGIITSMTSTSINQTVTINEDCGSKVCGKVYFDKNGNGMQDSLELGISNKKLIVSPGDFQITTDQSGHYEFYLIDGNYTISLATDAMWNQEMPVNNGNYSLVINKANTSIYCGNDFAASPVCIEPDLEVSLGTTAFRRGLTNLLHVDISNKGAYPTTSAVTLKLEMSKEIYLLDNNWDYTTDYPTYREYEYIFSSIDAMTDTILNLTDSVANTAVLDQTVFLTSTIMYSGTECQTSNNSQTVTDIVVGSLDPNDKLVLVKSHGLNSYVEMNDTIIYKIRFQNVGNYSARRVKIVDELDPNLDWNSFEMISTSHPFTVSVIDGIVTWLNPRIELPDSTSDLEGSQGYVSFSIMPKTNCKPFEVIYNTASIQFDYNDYITTNKTEITAVPEGAKISNIKVFAYPNPASSISVIMLLEENVAKYFNQVDIISLSGQTIQTIKGISTKRHELNLDQLQSGLYLLKITDENGKTHSAKLVVQNISFSVND
ncbi:MAG: FG-GAP-like repeat-containing protein [Crocinitomicaceae bacterium]